MMADVTGNCSDLPHLTTREMEALYSSSLYSIIHRLGMDLERTSPPRQQMFLYLQSVLDMSRENHENLLDAVEQMEPPLSVLTVTVIGAKGLVPMDSNGLSDPFCLMGCIPSDHMRRDVASNSCIPKDTRAFLLEKHLTPELLKVTSVKKKTLEPIWEESFQFELESSMIADHVLQVEIWDHDEETTMFKTVKTIGNVPNLKSMRRFFKEVAKTSSRRGSESMNDMQGVVMIPLNEIPSHGTEEWLPLHGKTPRKKYGEIKLRFSWTHKSYEYATHVVSTELALRTLWYKAVHHEVASKQRVTESWNGQLTPHGKSLLSQYAIQHGMSTEQRAMSQWIAYSQPCCLPNLEYKTILAVLQQLSCSSNPIIQESDKPIVRGCLYRFISASVSQLQKQRSSFPCRDVDAMVRLSILLKCLNETFILDKGLQLQLYQAGIKPSIIAAIKSDSCEGYSAMKSEVEQDLPEDDPCPGVTALARLTERLKEHLVRDLASMAHVYKQVVNLDCKDIVHRQLGDLVMQDVRSALDAANRITLSDEENIDASSSLFQLYQALKAFNGAYCSEETRDEPTPTAKFYQVFKRTVEQWFQVTKKQSLDRIQKAVELDKLVKMDSVAKHSTSAVDAIGCITVFVDFWNKLGWPEASGAYVFATSVTDDLCHCGLEYGRHIHEKLTAHGFYDTEGRFDVSNELCIAINNLEQVREYLTDLYDALHLDRVVADLETEVGYEGRVKCEQSLRTMIESADEDMLNTIGRIVCHATELMKSDVKKCLEDIVRAPDNVGANQVVVPILEYMDSNLTTLHSLVMENNFKRILGELWLLVLAEIHTMVVARKKKLHRQTGVVGRVKEALKILQDLFYADGNGLELDLMQGKEYGTLRAQLENLLVPTSDLILSVFQAKIQEQEEIEDEPLGCLSFRLFYNKKDGVLLVEVMNATNLTPLDSNGQSDPYVKVQLKPLHFFPDVPVMKTHTEKKTLHPIFDETFKFDVPASQCIVPGACVHFRVLDHDVIGRSEVEGEVFAPLNEVKGLTDSFRGRIDDLPVQNIALMKPYDQEGFPTQMLTSLTRGRFPGN